MKHISILLCLFISLLGSFSLLSQNETEGDKSEETSKFLIIITTNERGFQMECKEGCAWKELSFFDYTMQDGKIYYKKALVDDSGVGSYLSSTDKDKPQSVDSDTDFAFIVQQTEDGVFLESIKGTAWKKLSYRCTESDCRQAIDDMGMFMLDPTK